MAVRRKKAIVKPSQNGEWYYTLIGTNGKVLAHSECVKKKSTLLRTLARNFPDFKIEIVST